MVDVFLYTGEANPNDVKLRDPTTPASSSVTGTLATTLGDLTLAAAGTETFTATLATTLGNLTLAAVGTETFTGSLATTLGDMTLAGTGTETFPGTLATTLGDVTLAADGTAILAATGTLATTLGDATLAAEGNAPVTGGGGASGGSGLWQPLPVYYPPRQSPELLPEPVAEREDEAAELLLLML
jgi:hypothetical protein